MLQALLSNSAHTLSTPVMHFGIFRLHQSSIHWRNPGWNNLCFQIYWKRVYQIEGAPSEIFRRIRRQYTNWTKASIWISFFRSEQIQQQGGLGLALVISAEQMPPYCSIIVTLTTNKLSPGKTSTRLRPASSLRGKNEWSWSSAN
jgi:hypothetical protein